MGISDQLDDASGKVQAGPPATTHKAAGSPPKVQNPQPGTSIDEYDRPAKHVR